MDEEDRDGEQHIPDNRPSAIDLEAGEYESNQRTAKKGEKLEDEIAEAIFKADCDEAEKASEGLPGGIK